MEASDYLVAKARMTNMCGIDCSECCLSDYNNGIKSGCETFEGKYPDKAVELVSEWDKSHKVKTRQKDFLKIFPDAMISHGHLEICPQNLNKKYDCSYWSDCDACKRNYWITEIE